jgi:hypothetical protein
MRARTSSARRVDRGRRHRDRRRPCYSAASRPRTRSTPLRTSRRAPAVTCPTRFVSRPLSIVMTWDTFATESFGNLVMRWLRRRLPEASARRRLLVSGTTTTVLMRLRLNAFPCTMRTGLRQPGPEPTGPGRSARKTSPWPITTRSTSGPAVRPPERNHPRATRRNRKLSRVQP